MQNLASGLLLLTCATLASCGDKEQPPAKAKPPVAKAEPPLPSWAKVATEQLAAAAKHGVPVAFEDDLGQRFVLIPAGSFTMGSRLAEADRDGDEFAHEVTIARPFYMQIREVTLASYRWFDPMEPKGGDQPEDRIRPARAHLDNARAFATWLSQADTHRSYRLPTEEEWEHACRAATLTSRWWGNEAEHAWRYENLAQNLSDEDPHYDGHRGAAPGAQYPPNPWGLHDMLGNVAEVCDVPYRAYPEAKSRALDRSNAVRSLRPGEFVVRGASHRDGVRYARSAWRDTARRQRGFGPGRRKHPAVGFRLVSPLPPTQSAQAASPR